MLLTDVRFAGGLLGGSVTTRAALDEVLFTDPPLADMCTSFARQPILIAGVWLQQRSGGEQRAVPGAQDVIDQLVDALPEIRLACRAEESSWRPGPFHRALTELPVVFPPSSPLSIGEVSRK